MALIFEVSRLMEQGGCVGWLTDDPNLLNMLEI